MTAQRESEAMTPTPMLLKAQTEELTSSEIQTAIDELVTLNRGSRIQLVIGRGLWGGRRAAVTFDVGGATFVAAEVEEALCKAHKDTLLQIAAEAASDEDAA